MNLVEQAGAVVVAALSGGGLSALLGWRIQARRGRLDVAALVTQVAKDAIEQARGEQAQAYEDEAAARRDAAAARRDAANARADAAAARSEAANAHAAAAAAHAAMATVRTQAEQLVADLRTLRLAILDPGATLDGLRVLAGRLGGS